MRVLVHENSRRNAEQTG